MLLSHIKLLHNSKRGLKIVSLPHFLHCFWRIIFLLLYILLTDQVLLSGYFYFMRCWAICALYSIDWPNTIVWLPLVYEILGNMCIVLVWQPGCDVINFEMNLNQALSNQAVFSTWTKSQGRKKTSWEWKELLK